MEISKTIKIKLVLPDDNANALLNDISYAYRDACNFVSEYIFNHKFELNTTKLNKVLYRTVREQFNLKSQITQSVFRTVVARYKTVETQLQQKPFRYKDENGDWQRIYKSLDWLQKPIQFSRPQADYVRRRDYEFVDDFSKLSVNTRKSRLKVDFVSKGFDDYLDGSWKLGTAKLVRSQNHWFLHIAVSKEVEDFDVTDAKHAKHVVGIDRGLRFLATVYDDTGKTKFFDGKAIMRKRRKFRKLRAELQAKGTKAARRKLKKLSGRENRWMCDVNHRISRALVQYYGKQTVFVLEDLTNVTFERDNLHGDSAADNSSWAFYDLEQKLQYKALENQSKVVKVSAAYTSQRCVKCGFTSKANRNHQLHEFHCKDCGYRSNDDRIGAMNIQELGMQIVAGVESPELQMRTTVE